MIFSVELLVGFFAILRKDFLKIPFLSTKDRKTANMETSTSSHKQ